ncbi:MULTISPECIES: hypothetical protein [Streptomyces]|uniref:Uncharacterized protein n=1 Tax=Streptomyces dengpaensis TaxID=2049881 RepID=A0ABM6SZE2_9ACTN|nr:MULTISPECIES: hypothetical protein [Streptomyces]AVH59976.1 hypothetical protein C4B68_34055 [Streptomyces dengpaensis]PIB09613.1 hypothetical protein B1C81_10730 [Streptomyces sp. HG99]
MRRHPILWSLLAAYLLVVGLWPAAAIPVELAATGAFTVLAKPAVLLLVAVVALIVSALRRPAHVHAGRH